LPLLIHFQSGNPALYGMVAAMLVITLIKRLEANRRLLPAEKDLRRRVIWLRLLYDRDIPDHKEWIRRKNATD
jgi:hypothetical protein